MGTVDGWTVTVSHDEADHPGYCRGGH